MRRSLFLTLLTAALSAAACSPAPVGESDGSLQADAQNDPTPDNTPAAQDDHHPPNDEAPQNHLDDEESLPNQDQEPSNDESLNEADPELTDAPPIDEAPDAHDPTDEPPEEEPALDEPEGETPANEQPPQEQEPIDPVADGMARFRLSLIDAPVDDADGIYITVQAVRVQLFGDLDAPGDQEPVEEQDPIDEEQDPINEEQDLDDEEQESDDEEDGGRPETPGNRGNRGGQGNNDEEGGSWITLDVEPARYNLLELTNNVQAMLTEQELPAGSYGGVRLLLGCEGQDAPTIDIEGTEHPLTIPSGCQSGIKMPVQFDLAEGVEVSFIMDFDVRRSVHQTGHGRYIMRPVVRLLAEAQIGEISGTVPEESRWTAFAFAPGSYDPNSDAPFENALNSAIPTESGFFSITALPVGFYDVVIGDLDERHFFANVEVTAGGAMDLGDINFENQPVEDPPSDDEPSDESPIDDEPSDEPDELPADDEPSDEQPIDDQPSDEELVDQQPSDDEPSDEPDELPADDEPSDDQPIDDQPSDEEPVDQQPADDEPPSSDEGLNP